MITDLDLLHLRRDIYLALSHKSGVKEYQNAEAHSQLLLAAIDAADGLLGIPFDEIGNDDMAVTAVFRQQSGTPIVISNAVSSRITLASLANSNGTSTGARQSVKQDFGATRAEMWNLTATLEFAATPTAGSTVDFYLSPSSSATSGTDNAGNCTGADAAYAGYSSNLNATLPQLLFLGSFSVPAIATTTVQNAMVGRFYVPKRYGSLVVVNKSGVALHTTEASQVIMLTPDEGTSEPS